MSNGTVTAGEAAALLSFAGETFVLPGGATITGRWTEPTQDFEGMNLTVPQITMRHGDSKYLEVGDCITRLGTSRQYEIHEIIPDGHQVFTHFAMIEIASGNA